MTGKTHMIGGIAASLAYAHIAQESPMLMVGAGIVGALLPDICHGGSKIGKRLSVLSKIINALFGHRTLTHSLLFLGIIAFVMNAFSLNEALKAGVLVGMLSHYVLDMATKNGIKLFFPFSLTVRFPLTIKTGSRGEGLIAGLLAVLSFYYGYQAIGMYI